MFCARTNANINPADCHSIIMLTTDSTKFTACNTACLYGIGLAQSVRFTNNVQPGPAARLLEATMPNTTPNATPSATQNDYPHGITLSELATMAGVKYQNAWATVKDLRNGNPATSPASKAIMAKLAELGLTLDNLTTADRKAAATEKLKPVALSAPKPEAKPMLQAIEAAQEDSDPISRFANSFEPEENTAVQAVQVGQKPVERVLAAGKPIYFGIDMANGFDEQYLDRLPLETIIAAVHRRMPGAVVVCKAG